MNDRAYRIAQELDRDQRYCLHATANKRRQRLDRTTFVSLWTHGLFETADGGITDLGLEVAALETLHDLEDESE